MAKKLSRILTAVAIVAFAVPAVASATELTMPATVTVPSGTDLKGTSSNTEAETENGTFSCNGVVLNTEVLVNNGETVETGEGGANTASCLLDHTFPIEITNATFGSLHQTSPSSGEVAITYIEHLPGAIECHFEGTLASTYVSGTSSLHFEGLLSGGVCGEEFISGDYVIETVGGGLVIID